MNDRLPATLGTSSWPQATLTARARQLAADGRSQEAIAAELERQYPGQPSENHYANPAAIAVMERIRAGQREAQRREAHNSWRTEKGMPALPTEEEEPNQEPDEGELAAITSGRELLRLCKRYGIGIDYDDVAGSLRLSRQIDMTGPLAESIRRFRSSLVKLQSLQRAAP